MENAHLFSDPELHQKSLEFIENHSEDIMQSKLLKDLGPECLGEVLRSDKLAASEEDIFAAVLSWADCRCTEKGLEVNGPNIRQVLGDLLYLVRFPLMPPDGFVAISEQNVGLFTSNEEIKLLRGQIKNEFSKTQFPSRKRQGTLLQDVCYRFNDNNISHGWSYSKPDTLQFTVSKAVDVVGVVLFGNPSSTYNVHVGIIELNQTVYRTVTVESTEKTFKVLFSKPVPVKAGSYYTLKADLQNGPSGYKENNGLTSVTCKSTVFTFQTAPGTNNYTATPRQIYGIIFST
ncbi:BTB/POZ domain-containing protein 6-like [Argopecten irradians]|uniref:BTB/POZ domain-containing protein 6-like n=1 Tax=Argopecten irradians TaxID=31199 RepID=UPI00370F7A6C